ncbi:uncharacterized protein LOC143342617 isoform X2 [Colletes latitarsis]|uniref:uncharacterized protein LOC143342617 isoform X2 n=1 Tax=Colletes latitarsis TaxID=2605962 RepID=UPI004035AFAE
MRIIFVYICKVERKEETIRLGRLTLILVPVQMEVTPYFRSSFFLGPTGDDASSGGGLEKARSRVEIASMYLTISPKGNIEGYSVQGIIKSIGNDGDDLLFCMSQTFMYW